MHFWSVERAYPRPSRSHAIRRPIPNRTRTLHPVHCHLLTSGIGRGKVVAFSQKRGPAKWRQSHYIAGWPAFAVIDATSPSTHIEQIPPSRAQIFDYMW